MSNELLRGRRQTGSVVTLSAAGAANAVARQSSITINFNVDALVTDTLSNAATYVTVTKIV